MISIPKDLIPRSVYVANRSVLKGKSVLKSRIGSGSLDFLLGGLIGFGLRCFPQGSIIPDAFESSAKSLVVASFIGFIHRDNNEPWRDVVSSAVIGYVGASIGQSLYPVISPYV